MSIDKGLETNPEKRLITTNLLVSAADFESNEAMNLVALENLCHAIDIFCLYEKAVVLHHSGDIQPDRKSDFFGALVDANFLSFIQRSPQEVDAICRLASAHLAPALGVSNPDNYFKLFQSAWNAEDLFVQMTSDPAPDPKQWTTQLQWEREELSRTNTFVARTFLYLAYADQLQLTFTPDIQRNQILAYMANQEGIFRGKVLQALQKAYKESFQGYGDSVLQNKVSPCAAIVFERARGMKRNIPYEMTRLRKDLTSTRKILQRLEEEILLPRDQAKAQAAFIKWNDTVKALEDSYLSPPFRNAWAGRKLQSLLALAPLVKDAVAIGNQPTDPTKWLQFVVDLPYDKLVQYLKQRTIIDLYRVLQPPNLLQLRPLIVPLFGEHILW